MRILLDTSYLYRLTTQPARLSDAERLILTNQAIQLYVSAVSIWEMRLKFQSRDRVRQTQGFLRSERCDQYA